MRTKGVVLLFAGMMVLAIPAGSLYASCPNAPIQHNFGGTTWFQNCGPSPIAYAWMHKRGVQRVINTGGGSGNTASGHDSGRNQTLPEGMFLQTNDTNGNPIPGAYQGQSDFANPNWDGCPQKPEFFEVAAIPDQCGTTDYAPLNYVLAGVDPLFPNVAKVAALSVDYNQLLGAWLLDHAGAPPISPFDCAGATFQFNPAPVDCLPIPVPQITGTGACSAAGCNIGIGAGDVSALVGNSILDDCAVAESADVNCPRNLYQGRVLVFRHGACTPATGDAFDRRTWIYPVSGTNLNVAPNFTQFSLEDGDLDGVLDPNENDGANPPADNANGRLDPFVIPGTAVASTSIFVPAVPGAPDCIFLGMGILLDAGGGIVNPPTNTIFGESVVSPIVSLNNNPIRAGSATPVSDLVTTITATKLPQGKGKVDWSTGIEMTTSGFNVIGTKKGGGEVKINASLIEAQEGTTGKGASYSVTFEPGQLKGSSSVYVEIVKTNGSKERFGPASF